jgi:Family of unknown function (DUF6152)
MIRDCRNRNRSIVPRALLCTLLAVGLGATAPASAHHSYAMFDAGKVITFDATVKEFQWTNPHSWLQVVTVDDKGVAQEWSLEMGPLVALHRWGWKPHSVNPGDKVKVSLNPLRDGTRGGRLMAIVLPGGETLSGQGVPPAPAPTTSSSR